MENSIPGKVELSLETYEKMKNRIDIANEREKILNDEINHLIDAFVKLGIPEDVVDRIGKDVGLSCCYADNIEKYTRKYRIEFEVPMEMVFNK